MKKLRPLFEKSWFSYTFAACSAVILYLLLINIGRIFGWIDSFIGMLSPIIGGAVIAYLLDPIARFFEKSLFKKVKSKKTRRGLSLVLTIVLFLLVIILLIGLLVPNIVASVVGLYNNIDRYSEEIDSFLLWIKRSGLDFGLDFDNVTEVLDKAFDFVINYIKDNASKIIQTSINVGSGIFNVFIALILSVYFLFGKETVLKSIRKLRHATLSEETYKKRNRFWKKCNDIFIRYIGCSLLDALFVGIANSILMAIFGMDYIPLVSMAVSVTNLLPTFGPIVGAAIGAFILVLAKPSSALIFLIFTIVLQTIDGYIIKPKFFSSSMGVPAIWILVGIIVGGKLFGPIGMLLSIPVMSVINVVIDEYIFPFLERRKLEKAETGQTDELPQETTETQN